MPKYIRKLLLSNELFEGYNQRKITKRIELNQRWNGPKNFKKQISLISTYRLGGQKFSRVSFTSQVNEKMCFSQAQLTTLNSDTPVKSWFSTFYNSLPEVHMELSKTTNGTEEKVKLNITKINSTTRQEWFCEKWHILVA